MVDRETIDEVNILQAAMLAMTRAVQGLARAPDAVLVDGNRCAALLAVTFETVTVAAPGKAGQHWLVV